jgi:hypothetical protein
MFEIILVDEILDRELIFQRKEFEIWAGSSGSLQLKQWPVRRCKTRDLDIV